MGWKYSLAGLSLFALYKMAVTATTQNPQIIIIILIIAILLIVFIADKKKGQK